MGFDANKSLKFLIGDYSNKVERKGFQKGDINAALLKQDFKCWNKSCKKRFGKEGGLPQVHHIDGHRNNNNPSNLALVCAICHSNINNEQAIERRLKNKRRRARESNSPFGRMPSLRNPYI